MNHQETNGVEFEQGCWFNRDLELLLKLRSDFYGLHRIDAKFFERNIGFQVVGGDIASPADVVDEPVFE